MKIKKMATLNLQYGRRPECIRGVPQLPLRDGNKLPFLSFLFIFLIFVIITGCSPAFASGIQVSPARLAFGPQGGQTPAQQITVTNPGQSAQRFQIYAEDYPDLIVAEPNDFALAPGGVKIVSVTVNSQRLPPGLQTKLDVIAGPLPGTELLTVSAGAKIPISLQTARAVKTSKPINWPTLIFSLAALALFAHLLLKRRQTRRKEKSNL